MPEGPAFAVPSADAGQEAGRGAATRRHGEVTAALDPFGKRSRPFRRKSAGRCWSPLRRCSSPSFALADAVVYRIQTDKGELIITTESDDVEVVVKQGGKVVRIIDTKTG